MRYFDYETAAREAAMGEADLNRIVEAARREFPFDDMMAELHVLRTCMAVARGQCTLREAVEGGQAASDPKMPASSKTRESP